ncbi:hypothetical protein LOD99_6821 [Oopsacas minuta]|uniref:TLC domain-containing protein n=1 Tax=Oopsacas minuta TaxID=111878 RepID=A0AAV7JL66_9METZ|nr:hypothetical protein LOD99_6821 [Oopsacas minuta]
MPRHRKQSHTKTPPPLLSQEFLIQNHADIISVICILILLGLMFHPTNYIASLFISPQYIENATNVTIDAELLKLQPSLNIRNYVYGKGVKDLCTIFFYTCVCMVLHAVLQEYVWERISRRYHLSNTTSAKFYETGILAAFYLLSTVWGVMVIIEEKILSQPSVLWSGYYDNHVKMPFITKFYYLIQLAYWLHCYPELYFLKVPFAFVPSRVKLYTIAFLFTAISYYLSLQRFAICLLTMEAISEVIASAAKLLHYLNNDERAVFVFRRFWAPAFCIVRVVSVLLAVLVLYYGFGTEDVAMTTRIGMLVPTITLQILMSYVAFRAWKSVGKEVKKTQ